VIGADDPQRAKVPIGSEPLQGVDGEAFDEPKQVCTIICVELAVGAERERG